MKLTRKDKTTKRPCLAVLPLRCTAQLASLQLTGAPRRGHPARCSVTDLNKSSAQLAFNLIDVMDLCTASAKMDHLLRPGCNEVNVSHRDCV